MPRRLPPHPDFSTYDLVRLSLRGESFDFLAAAERWTREYGDLVYWNFFPTPAYIVNHPDMLHEVLIEKADAFQKPPIYKAILGRFLGDGLLVSDGAHWRTQRKHVQPAFHHARVGRYAAAMVDAAARAASTWESGAPFDADDVMMRLSLDIIARTLFDADVRADAAAIGAHLHTIQRESVALASSPLTALAPAWLPLPANVRQRRAIRALDGVIMRIIRARRASGIDTGDLLSMLLAHDADGAIMSEDAARDEAITLFMAGYETSAHALAWTWGLLATHPAVQDALYAELDAVLNGRAPTMDDLARLPYLDAIVKESLRLYPPAHGFGRQSTRAVQIGGWQIPKGAILFIYPYLVQRDARWFDAPATFDPARWLDGRTAALPKFAYFPFGGGARICIGSAYAGMLIRSVTATIAAGWRVRRAHGDSAIPHEALITLRPRDLWLIADRR
jgi:cytochrome P450